MEGGNFKLSNVVEADETYIGGNETNKHAAKRLNKGRDTVGTQPVAGARECCGKVEAQPIKRTDIVSLVGFREDTVEAGATIYTDDAVAYAAPPSIINQYEREAVRHGKGECVRGEAHANSLEDVCAVLKRSILGTLHLVSPKHLGRYVNEATFPLNEGNSEVDTIDRMTEFARGVGGKRLSYDGLIADNGLSSRAVPA